MIYLFYYRLTNRLAPDAFEALLQQLPTFLQQRILKFRNWEDAQRCLAGNMLLLKGLEITGNQHHSLQNLKYTEFQKPYLDEHIHFNIAHSGQYVICAISATIRPGVDIEEIKEIPIHDFSYLFAGQEWKQVTDAVDPLRAFYTLWTQKEAFLKLIGCGLSQPLNEVIISDKAIHWENKDWYLHEINLDPLHVAYLCCDQASPAVKLQEITFP